MSNHPIRGIMEKKGDEYTHTVILNPGRAPLLDQITENRDSYSSVDVIESLFPDKDYGDGNPYRLPFFKKVRAPPLIYDSVCGESYMVWNPNNKNLTEINTTASSLVECVINGPAVIFCKSQEEAESIRDELEKVVQPNGTVEKMFSSISLNSEKLLRNIGKRMKSKSNF